MLPLQKYFKQEVWRSQFGLEKNIDWQLEGAAKEYIDEEFLREYKDRIDWHTILRIYPFSENFLRELINFYKETYATEISSFQTLNERFIEEFAEVLDWKMICKHQKMSISFLDRWYNKLNFNYISQYQKLDDQFVLKYENELDWECIFRYQRNISGWILHKHKDQVSDSLYMYGMRGWH